MVIKYIYNKQRRIAHHISKVLRPETRNWGAIGREWWLSSSFSPLLPALSAMSSNLISSGSSQPREWQNFPTAIHTHISISFWKGWVCAKNPVQLVTVVSCLWETHYSCQSKGRLPHPSSWCRSSGGVRYADDKMHLLRTWRDLSLPCNAYGLDHFQPPSSSLPTSNTYWIFHVSMKISIISYVFPWQFA